MMQIASDTVKKRSIVSLKSFLAFFLSFSQTSLNTFVNDEPKAPSANISRNMLGIRLATKKASSATPAPKRPAVTDSLRRPNKRLKKVPTANHKLALKRDKISPHRVASAHHTKLLFIMLKYIKNQNLVFLATLIRLKNSI